MFAIRYVVLRVGIASALAAALASAACSGDETPRSPPPTSRSPATAPPTERVVGPLTDAEAQALGTMNERLTQYVELHRKLARELPALPDEATPEQIHANQRMLEGLVRKARAGAKPGDIFTAEARPVIKRLLARVFGGAEGKQLRASMMDENPVHVAVAVNGRYPDQVPLSTVPPEVLQTLPKLTEEMEYRFIGDHLILLDVPAHVIVDFVANALPE